LTLIFPSLSTSKHSYRISISLLSISPYPNIRNTLYNFINQLTNWITYFSLWISNTPVFAGSNKLNASSRGSKFSSSFCFKSSKRSLAFNSFLPCVNAGISWRENPGFKDGIFFFNSCKDIFCPLFFSSKILNALSISSSVIGIPCIFFYSEPLLTSFYLFIIY